MGDWERNVSEFPMTITLNGAVYTLKSAPPQWIFVPTGEVRIPKDGEYFWNNRNGLAFKDPRLGWAGEQFPIYRRVLVEELKFSLSSSPTRGTDYRDGYNACLAKLGIKP